jgi:type IV pilus assembly protein PilF
MSRLMLLLALALAGCAQLPGGSSATPASPAQPLESEARDRARAFTDLAAAYFSRQQLKIALDEVRKALAADSRYGPAYNVLGLIYMELAEDTLADENFRRALEIDRSDSVAHNNYGWFLCTRGRHDEGLARFSEALRNPLYPNPEQALLNSGLCAGMKGDLPAAEQFLRKALKLQPDYALANLKLAGLRYRRGDLEEARRLLERYSQLAPATAESLWLGVRLERKLGNRDQASAYGVQLRKNFPDATETQKLLTGQFDD